MAQQPASPKDNTSMFVTSAKPGPSRFYFVADTPQHVEANETTSFSYPHFAANELDLVLANPPTLPYRQKLTLTCSLNLPGTETRVANEKGGLGRSLTSLHAWSAKPFHDFQLTVHYEGTLYPYHIATGGACPYPAQTLDPSFRAALLSPDRELNFDAPAFHEFLRENGMVIKDGEDPVDFGFRAYRFIGSCLHGGSGTPVHTLTNLSRPGTLTDCGGAATMFAGIMRANGIPATILCGRLASSGQPGDSSAGIHCMAEFFIEGRGWCPVDPTVSMCSGGQDIGGFGRYNADFIVMHLGVDIPYTHRMHDGKELHSVVQIDQVNTVYLWTSLSNQTFAGNSIVGDWLVQRT
jgi:hypothetical protein